MAITIPVVTTPESPRRGAPFLIAPRRGRSRRTWFERQRSSRRGRFELALLGGGLMALMLAVALPGMDRTMVLLVLTIAGACMTVVATYTGFIPAITAAAFAPVVTALTDPMWTLGESISDFTLGNETAATFATFAIAAVAGTIIKKKRRERRTRSSGGLWRASPQRK